jgi:hypothetical protein
MKVDMQFLDHNRKQYLDLHEELIRINFSPRSEASAFVSAGGTDRGLAATQFSRNCVAVFQKLRRNNLYIVVQFEAVQYLFCDSEFLISRQV